VLTISVADSPPKMYKLPW